MPNGTYGGVRGRKTKVGRKLLLFSSYSIYPGEDVLELLLERGHSWRGFHTSYSPSDTRITSLLQRYKFFLNNN